MSKLTKARLRTLTQASAPTGYIIFGKREATTALWLRAEGLVSAPDAIVDWHFIRIDATPAGRAALEAQTQ